MSFVKSIEENFFALGRYWGSLNFSPIHSQAIYAMYTGIPTADLNWAWNEKPLTGANTKVIKKIKNHYERLALPFWWWVYPSGQSPFVKKVLEDEGIPYLTAIPCLAADLSALALAKRSPSTIAVSLVKNKKDLNLWEKTSFTGFEMEAASKKQYRKFIVSFDISAAAPQKLFLAYFEGKPAATALLFFHKGTAGIYFVSTLPACRRKGLGLAVTLAAMQYAKLAGFPYCILQSSESGLDVYRQAGFQEYCCADIYSLLF